MAGELTGTRVLLLAGSAVTRELVKVYLAEGGVEVVEASDARGLAVALAARPPHLAIIDLGDAAPAPEEVLPALRRRGLPVLGLAGKADAARAQAYRAAGVTGVLAKPLAPDEVLGAVAALVPPRAS
jgi:two-component system, chemotaxis family, chemotaxis protein CheY